MELATRLSLIAEDHGFLSVVSDGVCHVEIPWVHVETREEGSEWHQVRTLRELLNVLGY